MPYCNGAIPPMAVAVIVPLILLHAAGAAVAVMVGAGELARLTVVVFVQPFASFTVTV